MDHNNLYVEKCLWDSLKEEKRPIFLYGTGNGADKILNVLEERNIPVKGVFASDGFVRDRYFRGFKVLSYSDTVRENGDDIVILLCFGTDRPDVTSFIEELNRRHTLYIPDVPLYGGALFDKEYFDKNKNVIIRTRELLSDEVSKQFFDAAVNFRLTGKYEYLLTSEAFERTLSSLLDADKIKNIVDLGAYKGDTAKLFTSVFQNSENIYAVEPDPKTFAKLSEFAEAFNASDKKTKIIPHNFAASDTESTIEYSGSASRGAGAAGQNRRAKTKTVISRPVDSLNLENIDFIKYDVEGDEDAALRGSLKIISKSRPNLAVSVYHKTDDLFAIPLTVCEMLKTTGETYTFHLRRPPCIPAWDLMFYAVRH